MTEVNQEDLAEEKKPAGEQEITLGKDKPPFKEYCILLTESELIRIDKMQRLLKKARKEYIKLQMQFKRSDDAQVRKICENYPAFITSFDEFDAQHGKVDDDVKDMNRKKEMADAMDVAVKEQEDNKDQPNKEDENGQQ